LARSRFLVSLVGSFGVLWLVLCCGWCEGSTNMVLVNYARVLGGLRGDGRRYDSRNHGILGLFVEEFVIR